MRNVKCESELKMEFQLLNYDTQNDRLSTWNRKVIIFYQQNVDKNLLLCDSMLKDVPCWYFVRILRMIHFQIFALLNHFIHFFLIYSFDGLCCKKNSKPLAFAIRQKLNAWCTLQDYYSVLFLGTQFDSIKIFSTHFFRFGKCTSFLLERTGDPHQTSF